MIAFDPDIWGPAIFNYAVACDLFPQLLQLWDLNYLIESYIQLKYPVPENAYTLDMWCYENVDTT